LQLQMVNAVRPRGRPRNFSRELAVRKATELFWERGYEGTTVEQLQEAMGGISAPSFYAAFGSKEALFREALQCHAQSEGAAGLQALADGKTARSSVDGALRAAVAVYTQRGRPRGCLLVLGAINCMPENRSVQDYARDFRSQRHKFILQRLERAVAQGDLAEGLDLVAIASFYVTILDGLALAARDGVPRKTLDFVVEGAMAAWSKLVAKPRKQTRTGQRA
jgi:AcrR family transcriptional regulator